MISHSNILKRLIVGLAIIYISSFLTVGVAADVNLFDNDTYQISQDLVDASKSKKSKTRQTEGPEKPNDLKNQQTPQQRKEDSALKSLDKGVVPSAQNIVSTAKEADEKKKAEKTFDGTYEDAMNHLDLMTSKVWFGNDVLGMNSETMYLINTLIQGVFWIAKGIFYVCALVYEKLSSTESLDPYIKLSLDSGRMLFNILKNEFGFVAVILGTAYAYYDYALKNGSFIKNIIKMLVTIACSFMLFSQYNGKYVVQHVTDNAFMISQEVSGKVVNGLSKTLEESTNTQTTSLSGKDKHTVLTQYFKTTIWQAFKYMNSEVTIKEGQPKFSFTEEQFRELVFYPSGDGEFKVGDKKIKDIVGSKDKVNNVMMKDAWGKKTMYALAAIVDTLVLGIILDAFALFSFVSILLIILLLLLGAFVALLALFPKLEGFLFNWGRKLGTTIFVSSLATFFAVVVLWFYDLLTIVLSGLFNGNPILVAAAKVAIFIIVWKKRYWLMTMMTANQISVTTRNFARRFGGVSTSLGRSPNMSQFKDKALSKLTVARRSTRLLSALPAVGGAMVVAGAFDKGLTKRFNQKVQDKGKWLRQKVGLPEMQFKNKEEQFREGIQQSLGRGRIHLSGVKENALQTKNYFSGYAKGVLADGYGNSAKGNYLRKQSEELLAKNRKHYYGASNPTQIASNNATKEKLLALRQSKQTTNRMPYHDTRKAFYEKQKPLEKTFESRYRRVPITFSQKEANDNTKERLLQVREDRKQAIINKRYQRKLEKNSQKEFNIKGRQKGR